MRNNNIYIIATQTNRAGGRTLAVNHYLFGHGDNDGDVKVITHCTNQDRGIMWDRFLKAHGDVYGMSYAEAKATIDHCKKYGLENIQILEA